jgi:hypothetical protein
MAKYGRRITVGGKTYIESEADLGSGKAKNQVSVTKDSMGNVIVIEHHTTDFSDTGGETFHDITQETFPPGTRVRISDLRENPHYHPNPSEPQNLAIGCLIVLGFIALIFGIICVITKYFFL